MAEQKFTANEQLVGGAVLIVVVLVVVTLVVYVSILLAVPVGCGFLVWHFWLRDYISEQKQRRWQEREKRDTKTLYEAVRQLEAGYGDDDETLHVLFGELESDVLLGADGTPAIGEELHERALTCVYDLYHTAGLGKMRELDWSKPLRAEEGVQLRNEFRNRKALWENRKRSVDVFTDTMREVLTLLRNALPSQRALKDRGGDDGSTGGQFSVPLGALLEDAGQTVERVSLAFFDDEVISAGLFKEVQEQLDRNTYAVSDIPYEQRHTTTRKVLLPSEVKGTGEEIVSRCLRGTPLADLFAVNVPFTIPAASRFEHTMILAGSGHGKTQTLQHLLATDLEEVRAGKASLVVIDSQGDLISNIAHLEMFAPNQTNGLSERLLLIDPNHVEHPPALNLFDINMERINSYSAVEREKIMNGTVELYNYIFGALLGAEMTQKQSVIFTFLARLMLAIPDATIETLRDVMENGEAYRPYMDRLDGAARGFFATQFFDKSFADTKKQILRRLWGVLGNPAFERMFANRRNKVDMFSAMNGGSVVLVNTAKEFLQQQWCEIFGRFFIALVAQAAIQRAAIPESQRLKTYLYIDEASDYFDDHIELLLNTARKYRVGVTIANQNLTQMETSIRATVMASTSIKLVGGASAKDARLMADEMRCDASYIQNMKKREDQGRTEFACMVRNVTPQAVRLSVPFGVMERLPKMNDEQYDAMLALNHKRVCDEEGAQREPALEMPEGSNVFQLGEHKVI